MNKIQDIIKGKPKEFSRRTGSPLITAKSYSNGQREPSPWICDIIKWAISKGYGLRNKYIKKPVVIVSAVQFTGKNTKEILRFIYPDMFAGKIREHIKQNLPIIYESTSGTKTIYIDDYVIRDKYGYVSVMKEKMFKGMYEEMK